MEVKIGIQDSRSEISLESTESQEAVLAAVQTAIADGGLLTLTDDRGRTVLVAGSKITYVEVGASSSRRGRPFSRPVRRPTRSSSPVWTKPAT